MASAALNQLKLKARSFVNTVRNSKSAISRKRLAEENGSPEDVLSFEQKAKMFWEETQKELGPYPSKKHRRKAKPSNDFQPPIGVYGVSESTGKEVQAVPNFKQPRKQFKKMREARESEGDRTVFIGNLSLSVKESDLLKLCSQFGK